MFCMLATGVIKTSYQYFLKPIFFSFDPEYVHNRIIETGDFLGSNTVSQKLTQTLLAYENPVLEQNVQGIDFKNPIGLAAGFDYNGYVSKILKNVGFGFNTVGTVTARFYEGNPPPRLVRLTKSRSLLVNKGFKSDGAEVVAERLDKKGLEKVTVGVSIGSSNICEIDTVSKAIDDYMISFNVFKNRDYVKYYEVNVSCPNTSLNESFSDINNLDALLGEVVKLKINKPIFIKMPNEASQEKTDGMITTALKHGINGFIFSNLVKDRSNPVLNKEEVERVKNFKGGFSGKPTFANSNKLIQYTRKKYGKDITIIGCGGVFNAEEAYTKIRAGADLVQMVTGLIYEGPQVIGEINQGLSKLLRQDGLGTIGEAVGADL